MGLLCYSLKNAGYGYCEYMATTLSGVAVEIRLDECELSDEEIHDLFSCERDTLLVATCHCRMPSEEEEASRKLAAAVIAGADCVDIPLGGPAASRKWLMSLAMNHGCKTIVSYHDYNATPSAEVLLEKARQAQWEGADVVKIVTTAHDRDDVATVMSLYEHFEPGRLLAFCMGSTGRNSRYEAFEKGAPFLFVAPTREDATASGQPTFFDLLSKDEVLLRGEAELPASKSFAQRAILLAALTGGTTRLYHMTPCDDTLAAISVAEQLYAEVSMRGDQLTIVGRQDIPGKGLKVRDDTLFVGESGLLARLCIPLAGLADEDITIKGAGTLLRRRIDDHRSALRSLGLKVEYSNRHYLPAVVRGRLHEGEVEVDGTKGSQLISGLMLALSQCPGESAIHIEEVTSEPYISLTTYVASFFGLTGFECPEIDEPVEDPEDDNFYRTWYISPSQKITPVVGLEVERDWSAAAMMLVAGAVAGDVAVSRLDMLSCQADAMIYDVLKENHADVVLDQEKGRISVRRSMVTPFFYDIVDAPDLFAPLFLLAVFTEGESVIAGISRLHNKESDRAASFAEEFGKLGVQTSIYGDEITIYGHERPDLRGARCSSHGDHRLAMALLIASLRTRGKVTIDDLGCIDKSFPGFVEIIEKLKQK